MTRHRILIQSLLPILVWALIAGCGLFKSTEKTMQNVEKITEKIETKVESAGKEKAPSETHQGPLVDNKVAAMRMQDALKREGADYQHVVIDATKDEIVMTGTVNSTKARERAEQIARSVSPHAKLKNELKVVQ